MRGWLIDSGPVAESEPAMLETAQARTVTLRKDALALLLIEKAQRLLSGAPRGQLELRTIVGGDLEPPGAARRPQKPSETVYAISFWTRPHEYGMTHGPAPSLREMLHEVPSVDEGESVILRFGADGRKMILYRWKNGGWLEEQPPKPA